MANYKLKLYVSDATQKLMDNLEEEYQLSQSFILRTGMALMAKRMKVQALSPVIVQPLPWTGPKSEAGRPKANPDGKSQPFHFSERQMEWYKGFRELGFTPAAITAMATNCVKEMFDMYNAKGLGDRHTEKQAEKTAFPPMEQVRSFISSIEDKR